MGGAEFFPTNISDMPMTDLKNRYGGPDLLENRAVMEAMLTIRAVKNIGAYQSVKFNDPVTTVVIQRCFGGWITLCTDLEENEEKWFRNEFVKYYQTYTKRNIPHDGHLMGLLEDGNRKSGYEDWIPKPVLVEEQLKQMGYKN